MPFFTSLWEMKTLSKNSCFKTTFSRHHDRPHAHHDDQLHDRQPIIVYTNTSGNETQDKEN